MKINFKIIVFLILFLLFSSINANDSLGNVYKLKYYNLETDDNQFLRSLSEFNLQELSRREFRLSLIELEKIGDRFAREGKLDKALIVYSKIHENSGDYWQVYNKIENLERKKGSFFFSIKNFLRQTISLLHNSDSFFVIAGLTFSSLYFASILIFFIFAIILFYRYFKIFSNDSLNAESGDVSVRKIVVFSIALLWPFVFFSGWMIFPFIITGLFWSYFNRNEKQSIMVLIILIFVFSVFFSIRSYLNKSMESETFYTVNEVNSGKYFSKSDYTKFDNELKVYLAFSYYENKDYNSSLDILLSTGEGYRSILKFNLLGNIYYKSGNFEESMKYFKDSLDLNENDEIALHNFAIVLAIQNNSKIFDSYASRFPEIKQIINNVHKIKEIKVKPGLLKRRAFYSSKEKFAPFSFFVSILKEFIELPIMYFSLLTLLYIYFINLVFSKLGESIRCEKCSKIIKETSADASNHFCNECYQLFMIKDVIFLEAKVAKEEKIKKKQFIRGIFVGGVSIFFPGLNFIFKEKYLSFIIFSIIFYTFAVFSITGKILFENMYSIQPVIFNITSIITVIFYLFINLYSVKGDSDGF